MVVGRVYYDSRDVLNSLAAELDIWEVHHDAGYAVAGMRRAKYDGLRARGYRVEIDEEKTAKINRSKGIDDDDYSSYRTVEETYASMENLAVLYPDLCELHDIGDSWDKTMSGDPAGYDLLVLALTNKNKPGDKFKFFLLGEIHARELVTAETATRFAEYLLERYGTDPDVTWLLDYGELHVMPMANPDGRKWAEQGYYWRKNTDRDDGCDNFPEYGTDLNRNSSFHWDDPPPPVGASTDPAAATFRGPGPASESETAAIQDYIGMLFLDQRGQSDTEPAPDDATGLFITLHSYGNEVLWPWGWGSGTAPNATQLQRLGRKFAFFNGYEAKQSYYLYATTGTTDDWTYGELGVAAYTFEMGTDFFQDSTTFESTIYPDNLNALLWGFKSARRPYLMSAGPDTTGMAVGTGLLLTATSDGTRYSAGEMDKTVAAARYTVDNPSWETGAESRLMEPADGSFNSTVETVTSYINTAGLAAGRHIVLAESSNTDGVWGAPSAVFFNLAEGDINGDGVCNISDALLCLRMALAMDVTVSGQKYIPSYPAWLAGRADMDAAGSLDILDVVLLLRSIIE